jgi:ribosomal protein L12E/L44/L45/RPP1/RPP2
MIILHTPVPGVAAATTTAPAAAQDALGAAADAAHDAHDNAEGDDAAEDYGDDDWPLAVIFSHAVVP